MSMPESNSFNEESSQQQKEGDDARQNEDPFPEMVLIKIFEKCDPVDKITFSRAHNTLHSLVSRKRPEFLAHEFAEAFLKVLSKTELTEFRKICPAWNRAIIHQLDHTQMKYRNVMAYPVVCTRKKYFSNKFRSAASIQRFRSDMSAHPGNPFLDRDVRFLHDLTEEGPGLNLDHFCIEYWSQATQLLRKFGSNVHSITFGPSYTVKTVAMCDYLRECLSLVPNLRQLNFLENIGGMMLGDMEIQPDFFSVRPLPRLEYLEEIFISGVDIIIIREILSSCPNPAKLKTLIMKNAWLDPSWEFPESVFNFMNLELLEAEICIRDFQRFSSRTNVPPLKVLHWGFPLAEHSINPQLVFKALEPFHNTLASFDFSGSLEARGDDDLAWSVSVYNLHKLAKLHLSIFWASFDPFVHFKSLACLCVASVPLLGHANLASSIDLNPVSDVGHTHILGMVEKMYESNIWELIPSLTDLNVMGYYYQRENYDNIGKGERVVGAGDVTNDVRAMCI